MASLTNLQNKEKTARKPPKMYGMQITNESAELFRHLSAEKAALYRSIMDVFAAAKRQYRLQLRPDEVMADADWGNLPGGTSPRIEDVTAALSQLTAWGNLESHPDTARVSTLSDFYRARFLYRLSHGGEAVESALTVFVQTLQRRAELQTVALEDIASRLQALQALVSEPEPDVAKTHAILRDLVRVFESLAENAQAFMASVARSIELQQAEATAVATYKRRLIDYLERFIGDLVRRSNAIARCIVDLEPHIDALLAQIAEREARDAAPGDPGEQADAQQGYRQAWQERWKGLRGWFLSTGHEPPQAELLRARARSAIPQLLAAIAALTRRISVCSRPGLPPAPTTARRTASRAPRLRSTRPAISCSRPTPRPTYRPARRGPTRRRSGFIRACASTAKRRRAGRCPVSRIAAATAPALPDILSRRRIRWKRLAGALPPASRRSFRSSAGSTSMPSACSWGCSAKP